MNKKYKYKQILDSKSFRHTVMRLAHQIIEDNTDVKELYIIGISKEGIPISKMITENLRIFSDIHVNQLSLDLNAGKQVIPDLNDKNVIIVDSLIQSGTTILSAVNYLLDLYNPNFVKAAVLIDRRRELVPVCGNYIGKDLPTGRNEKVLIHMTELGNKTDEVVLKQEL